MSLFLPDLERDLRRAIRANAHRSDNGATAPRRKLGSRIAIAAPVLVTLLVVAVAIRAGGGRVQQNAARSVTPHRTGAPFAAFDRARTPADALPSVMLRLLHTTIGEQHANASASRRVFASPAESIWLLPAVVRGNPGACIVTEQGTGGGLACETNKPRPTGIFVLTLAGLHVESVLTRATDLRVTLKNGHSNTLTPNTDGALVRTFPSPIRHIAFVTP